MLIDVLKRSFVFQDTVSWLVAKIPTIVEHNLQKYWAVKKAFYLTGLERLDGDYLEFGVFTGSSFVFALRAHKTLGFLGNVKTRFYGYDSFSGFGKVEEHDRHPFYIDSIFAVNAERVIRNIKRKAGALETHIAQGYFNDTLANKRASEQGIERARIVFIDCDLLAPARLALDFVAPTLQKGTILLMDDFYSYRGDDTQGVAGAFASFKLANPQIRWRRIFDYGYGGVAFIAADVASTTHGDVRKTA